MGDIELSPVNREILLTHLRTHGVLVPESCKAVFSGQNGLCFIGNQTALKIFKHMRSASNGQVIDSHIKNSNEAYGRVTLVADEIEKRGFVKVPRLIDHGALPAPFEAGGHHFLAWQLMSRIDGEPVPSNWYKEEVFAQRIPEQMALIAAHIHVAASNSIEPQLYYPPFKRNIRQPNDNLRGVLLQLDIDMKKFDDNKPPNVLLHGDFDARNILDNGSTFGVIDWDQQGYGRPEYDLNFISDWPYKIEELCAIYNSAAAYPLNPNFMIAKGYNDALSTYHFINNSELPNDTKCVILEDKRGKLLLCAEKLTQLTGKPIYMEFAEQLSANLQPTRGPTINEQPTKEDPNFRPRL